MEESKELQGTYTLFRVTIYVSLLLEFLCMRLTQQLWISWAALSPTYIADLGGYPCISFYHIARLLQ